MEKQIVNVRYCGRDRQPAGRPYSYYTEISLQVGDRVIVPTFKGDGEAVVVEIDVPESRIDERIPPVLKTVLRKAVPEE